jgi:hypothetical protein
MVAAGATLSDNVATSSSDGFVGTQEVDKLYSEFAFGALSMASYAFY